MERRLVFRDVALQFRHAPIGKRIKAESNIAESQTRICANLTYYLGHTGICNILCHKHMQYANYE
jgi:hypothetical protein